MGVIQLGKVTTGPSVTLSKSMDPCPVESLPVTKDRVVAAHFHHVRVFPNDRYTCNRRFGAVLELAHAWHSPADRHEGGPSLLGGKALTAPPGNSVKCQQSLAAVSSSSHLSTRMIPVRPVAMR